MKDRLITAMQKRRVTAYKLSKQTGVPQPRISEILSGKVENPKLETVVKLAAGLNVDIEWLMTGKGQMEARRQAPSGTSVAQGALEDFIEELKKLPTHEQLRILADAIESATKQQKKC